MKLYNVPNKTMIYIKDDLHRKKYFFDHIDGMYSYCTDENGNVVHLQAWLDVEILKPEDEIYY